MKEEAVLPEEGRNRVIIESVTPAIDGGRFPIKRIVGDETTVEAIALTDGHDALSCAVIYRKEGAAEWTEVPMTFLINDRWQATFTVQELGVYKYTVQGWVDHFKTGCDFAKRAGRARSPWTCRSAPTRRGRCAGNRHYQGALATYAQALGRRGRARQALSDELAQLITGTACGGSSTYRQELTIVVDMHRAVRRYENSSRADHRCRPAQGHSGRGGAAARGIDGLDVLYLPPIHHRHGLP